MNKSHARGQRLENYGILCLRVMFIILIRTIVPNQLSVLNDKIVNWMILLNGSVCPIGGRY